LSPPLSPATVSYRSMETSKKVAFNMEISMRDTTSVDVIPKEI
jgi:hypothetical protein